MATASLKNLIGNSFSLFGIRLAVLIAGLVGMIVYSHRLLPEDYAQYQFLLITLSIFIAFGSLGISSVIFNFSSDGFSAFIRNFKSANKLKYIILMLALSLSFAGILIWKNNLGGQGFLVFFLLCLFSITAFVLENILLIYPAKKVQLITNWLYAALWLAAHYWILKAEFNLLYLAIIWTILVALKSLVLFFVFNFQYKKEIPALAEVSSIQIQKETWWHLGFYEIFQLVVKQMDKFILSFMTSAQVAATYYNGRIEIPFLPAILSAVRNAALVQLKKNQEQTEKLVQTVRHAFQILSTIGIAVTAFGIAYSEDLIITFFSDKYSTAVPIFIITLLILPAQYCISLSYVLQYKEKAQLINKGAFLDFFLTLILLYPFYLYFDILGIVLAVLISTYIQSFYYLYHASKITRVQILKFLPLKDYLIKCLIFGILAFGLQYCGSLIFIPKFNLGIGSIVGFFIVAWFLKRDLKKEALLGV